MFSNFFISAIFKSCQLAIESLNASTHSWIKHDAMTNAVRVRCIKQISGTYIALLDHDSEDRTEVSFFKFLLAYDHELWDTRFVTTATNVHFIRLCVCLCVCVHCVFNTTAKTQQNFNTT